MPPPASKRSWMPPKTTIVPILPWPRRGNRLRHWRDRRNCGWLRSPALVGRPVAELPPLLPKPLPATVRQPARQRQNRFDFAPRRHHGEPLARRSGRKEFGFSARGILSGCDDQRTGRVCPPSMSVNCSSTAAAYRRRCAAVHLPIFDAGPAQGALRSEPGCNRFGRGELPRDAGQRRARCRDPGRHPRADFGAAHAARDRGRRRPAAARAARRHASGRASRTRARELAATESWMEQRDALLQLDAAALSADIALQRALGGGYESPQELADTHSTATTTTP